MIEISQRQRQAPRRQISRVKALISQEPGTGVLNAVVYTAEDPVTLVRVRFTGNITIDFTGTGQVLQGIQTIFQLAPGGSVLLAPSVTTANDVDVRDEELFGWLYNFFTLDTGQEIFSKDLEVDSKAMRKMKSGDQLVFSSVAAVNNPILRVTGRLDMWFKH